MKEYQLKRIIRANTATLGILYDGENKLAYSLENPSLNNHDTISCIPAMNYVCEKDNSGKFQYWKVLNVSGRSLIEIHNGNLERHTRGCILFGSSWAFMQDKKPYPELAVTSSKPTLKKLKDILPDKFILKITNEIENAN